MMRLLRPALKPISTTRRSRATPSLPRRPWNDHIAHASTHRGVRAHRWDTCAAARRKRPPISSRAPGDDCCPNTGQRAPPPQLQGTLSSELGEEMALATGSRPARTASVEAVVHASFAAVHVDVDL